MRTSHAHFICKRLMIITHLPLHTHHNIIHTLPQLATSVPEHIKHVDTLKRSGFSKKKKKKRKKKGSGHRKANFKFQISYLMNIVFIAGVKKAYNVSCNCEEVCCFLLILLARLPHLQEPSVSNLLNL